MDLLIFDELFSSSSESSDSEEEILDIIFENNENHPRRRKARVQNFIENVIYEYDNKSFQENFRMQKTTFNYLLFLLRNDLEEENYSGRIPMSAEKLLYITLYVLATPDSYRSVVTKFNVGNATAWRAVRKVVKILCTFRNYFIRWPNRREINDYSRRLQIEYGFPGVIGALDGTHICILAPLEDS
ncbi:protein ANTAGONIST OF LIKE HETEROCHROMATIN PROTEIN 1-like isoform X1 [Solenopsis invicta]|uniref:protein ANTAGONIST OF LIKE HETEROCHROMATIN PROTEIN 1-like isoform X1 n=1 Tax=Solenopsis invicta TaxID=13686 RepID=UPI00193E20E0|nr:protein ANTAGONIST OF LIKE HETEROCHROMATIN PROTEIN 1-like isoform X1 [Solenopsis invicta]XP_039302798.1 protein ANTAGONIST OF LIKE HETEROCHROMATIN PROTEIN 1-like isoform X1 [Solenopsis invicta]XP_039302799.1 protein ANTAGONIST OF LIKE HETEROCHROMATIN PROTEIN 1-like isoform X1 [Solenopsis invicta]XP_039305416.1 protein ANTAGONIST OF LIKE HETEROCHROMATIN PROTEIN 1-like isoform X1 [Solenopsis invicta]XP_039305417.1 protein ANTAGONIST OF LIKE HETEROCHROMATIN PROTEIN 1-like isoform X1 [Solenopsis